MIEADGCLGKHRLPPYSPVPWPSEGEVVAGFTILRELGRGTFARVYLATEAAAGDRPVALKFTLEGGAEACILGRMPHPNIIHVNSAGEHEEDGRLTSLTRLCMPFLGTATLHDLLRSAYPRAAAPPPTRGDIILETVARAVRPGDPPPYVEPGADTPNEVLRSGSYCDGVAELGRQIADALAFLHKDGVYHRDLKPTNVLLAPGGRPVLLDFNLSCDGRLATKHLGGTLPYMAPEQIQASVSRGAARPKLDGRADLFSLGVLLYELLTGRLPFPEQAPRRARRKAPRKCSRHSARDMSPCASSTVPFLRNWPPLSNAVCDCSPRSALPTLPSWQRPCATIWLGRAASRAGIGGGLTRRQWWRCCRPVGSPSDTGGRRSVLPPANDP